MSNNRLELIAILMALVLGILGICCLASAFYKQGQIDYANGVIKYKLVKQVDGSTIWSSK